MSLSTLEELAACKEELLDVKPDFSVLCHDTSSTTIADCSDVKSEVACDITPTTSSQQQSDVDMHCAG